MVAAVPRKASRTNRYLARQMRARFLMSFRYSVMMNSSRVSATSCSILMPPLIQDPQYIDEVSVVVTRGRMTSTVQGIENAAAHANTTDSIQASDHDGE